MNIISANQARDAITQQSKLDIDKQFNKIMEQIRTTICIKANNTTIFTKNLPVNIINKNKLIDLGYRLSVTTSIYDGWHTEYQTLIQW